MIGVFIDPKKAFDTVDTVDHNFFFNNYIIMEFAECTQMV